MKPITLAYVDIDNFKAVNDTLGHDAGDALLRSVAKSLTGSLRITDIVARVGGDEFVFILPDQDQDGARIALSKVQRELGDLVLRSNATIGFSIGVVTALPAPNAVETMVQAADALMYQVKQEGKSGARFAMLEGSGAERRGTLSHG
jgi:diguanylate cyclase (GGDEF)-like protein